MNTINIHQRKSVSFIVPAMNEEKTIKTLYRGIQENVQHLCDSWEVIFIDDGSTDGTWDVMKELAMRSSLHVKAYKFPANRGKADALALGYNVASGDVVFTMDADLQDDPKEIGRFLEKIDEGNDIVTGWKRKRHDPWHKVLPSRVFNAVLSKVTGVELHDHNCGFKAYRKAVVKSLPMYGDMHRMVPSLASFQGFNTTEIEVEHHARVHGVSKYGWSRLMIGVFDTMTVGFLQRFRNCPMHFTGKIGAGLAVLGGSLLAAAAVSALLGGAAATLAVLGMGLIMTSILVCVQGLMLEQQVYRNMEQGRDFRLAESVNINRSLPSVRAVADSRFGLEVMRAG
ncbi:glycosyltransferase family 2 protein [Verrucomicrobiaceae bacterium R5-34]|nr:glycosyltransferase family 2 protein [Verrucomicrobiaceae bacterium R5-34]